MIGRVRGHLLEKSAPLVLVNVQGIAYELLVPMTTLYCLPDLGDEVELHTHFAVSEAAQQLFGFFQRHDRDFFRLLIKVNGVGPKMALGIMSIDTDDIVRFVMNSDIAALTRVPGVGKKTAERLVIEMRDRLKSWQVADSSVTDISGDAGGQSGQSAWIADAESALIALGYKPTEAAKAVSKVLSDEVGSGEELIRLALKSMLPVS